MSRPSSDNGGAGSGLVKPVLMAACVAGVALLLYRGLWRGVHSSGDLAIIYGSARAWLVGGNPYDAAAVARAWTGAGGPPEWLPGQTTGGGVDAAVFLYPPTTFPLLAPLAVLPWRAAVVAWAAVSLAMWAAAAVCVAAVAGLRRGSAAWWGVMAGAAWLAPAATSLNVGQLALVTVGLVAVGRWSGERELSEERRHGPRGAVCGILEGVATALKPQVAGLFLVYDAGRLRWGRVAWGAAVIALAAVVGVGRMAAAGVPWWPSWRENLRNFTLASNGDPTLANPIRHQIISLHEPLHAFTDNRPLVSAAVWGIVAGLSAAYFVLDLRRGRARGEGRAELVSLSMVAVVSLMVVYHRFYDAALLIWPLGLAVQEVVRPSSSRSRAGGWVLLALVAVFFVPGAVMLASAAERGLIPAALTNSALWQGAILAHEAWAIFAMACVLVWMRASRGGAVRQ